MKQLITCILILIATVSFGQDKEEEQLLSLKKANDFVYQGNELIDNDNYISAEMEYRKAISEQPTTVAGAYNLGNAYYKKGNYEEALYRHQQAAKSATTKAEKHKAFHNIGNILMQNKKCKEAVEAYKNALRNNPADDESRYNLVLAKECAEQQGGEDDKEDKDKDKDKEEEKENEDKKDKEGDNEEDKKDEGDKKDEEGEPEDEKSDKGGDEKKKEQQKPKPQPGQLSPQQIKNLLEAMNNQEQKVQEKINADKQKGAKVKTEKDW